MHAKIMANGWISLTCAAIVYMSTTVIRGSEVDRIYDFLENNVVNRTLLMEREGTLAGGAVGYSFRREATLCNLVRSAASFRYDGIYRISQKNWDVDKGQKTGEPRTEDRLMVVRYEFGLRESTGEVTGYMHTLTSTRREWGGSTSTYRVRLQGDRLEVQSQTGLYDDYFGPGGSFFPGASIDTQQWFLRDGKLVCESQTKVYRVNPETLDRELIHDREPFAEQEIARLPLK